MRRLAYIAIPLIIIIATIDNRKEVFYSFNRIDTGQIVKIKINHNRLSINKIYVYIKSIDKEISINCSAEIRQKSGDMIDVMYSDQYKYVYTTKECIDGFKSDLISLILFSIFFIFLGFLASGFYFIRFNRVRREKD